MDATASKSEDVAAMRLEEPQASSSCSEFVAAHIELSKHHWSELSKPIIDGISRVEVALANVEAFTTWESHPEWGAFFFKTFGDYSKVWESQGSLKVGEKFAEGGQAELFHACVKWRYPKDNEDDLKSGIEYVLKVFKEGTLVKDLQPQWHEGLFRYIYDGWKLQELGKPLEIGYICQVVCATLLEDGRFAFLMIKEDGDLRSLIDRKMVECDPGCGPFSKEVGEEIIYRVTKGMDCLHSYNIVHRDLKASNVLVKTYPSEKWVHCYVADFESSIGVVGTGFWRAPEILRAHREKSVVKRPELFSRAADCYSYGMTCYEILTGKVPFEGHPLSDQSSLLMDLVIDQHLRPEVPDYVEDWARDLLHWCWKPAPDQRPSFKTILGILKENANLEHIQVTMSERLTDRCNLERATKALETLEVWLGDHLSVVTGLRTVPESSSEDEQWCHMYRMVLLFQVGETKSMLRLRNVDPVLKPGHIPLRRELYRAVCHMEALVKEWWSVSGSENLVLVKRKEHFLEALLTMRWWTLVVAVEAGDEYLFSTDESINVLFNGGNCEVSQALVLRHFPSYGFEIWWRETGFSKSCFQDETFIGSLEAIRNADFLGFFIVGSSNVDEAKVPLIAEEIQLDLTKDVLGVSPTGSWVIKIKYEGVDCALKRVTSCDRDQRPAIACVSLYPHVVQLMHYWRKDDAFFLMMELMEGDLTDLISWHRRASESLISVPLAVDIMLQTAKGMLYLHDMDITYPHLSCSNILFQQRPTLGFQPDEPQEYTIKLGAGGSYCTNVGDDSSGRRKTQDVYRFGLFCLELWTGSEDPMDHIDADTKPDISETLPPMLKFCIASCFEGDIQLGFGHVVTMLLLAQYEVLKKKDFNEAFLSFERKDLRESALQHSQQGCESTSISGADHEKLCRIHQLYPDPASDPGSYLPVTLIFFHGFAKSRDEWKSTWMTRNREHVWPEAWLPKDLPRNRVRILVLSYDVTNALGDIQNAVEAAIGKEFNVLRRLVLSPEWNLADPGARFVLIGHSFGGLIIKSLIVEAHKQAYLRIQPRMEDQQLSKKCLNFLENLGGIVFYGVPGSASPDEQFEQYIHNLNQTGLLKKSSLMQAVLKDTKKFSDEMLTLSSQFEVVVPENVKILCFIEGKGMRKILSEKQLVVSEASAKAQLKKADFTVLEKDNHFEVCRPISRDHISYKILVEHILNVMPGIDSLNAGAEEGRDLRSKDISSNSLGYECKTCGKKFNSEQCLGGHMNLHRSEKDQTSSRSWRSPTESSYRGIWKHPYSKRWLAKIRWPTSKVWLGTYNTAIEAAYAYDVAATYLNCKTPLNFDGHPIYELIPKVEAEPLEEVRHVKVREVVKKYVKLAMETTYNQHSNDEPSRLTDASKETKNSRLEDFVSLSEMFYYQ